MPGFSHAAFGCIRGLASVATAIVLSCPCLLRAQVIVQLKAGPTVVFLSQQSGTFALQMQPGITYELHLAVGAAGGAYPPPGVTMSGQRHRWDVQLTGGPVAGQSAGWLSCGPAISFFGLPAWVPGPVPVDLHWAGANSYGPGASDLAYVVDVQPNGLRLTGTAVAYSSYRPTPPVVAQHIDPRAGVNHIVALTVPSAQAMQLTVTSSSEVMGAQQPFPLLPNVGSTGFVYAATGNWFDPPLALGYEFQQTGSSLFTDILSLPVGIDGDGLFEVQVGSQSLGQFAAGTRVDFRQLLGGNGVPAFRILGIEPAVDSADVGAFPVKLAFATATADFTMTPVLWRKVGTSCADPVCPGCATTSLAPVGTAVEGNLNFGLAISNGPANGIAACSIGVGPAAPTPLPLFCGEVHFSLQFPIIDMGAALLPGSATCDGAGSFAVPLPTTASLFGQFLTAQALTLCPAGGFGLTHGIEFAVGN